MFDSEKNRIFGRIIYVNELVNHDKVNYIQYVNNDCLINDNIPTLFVGWNSFKTVCGHDIELSILNKEIKRGLYWEFSFEERKNDHINGVQNFIFLVPEIYFLLNYRFINIDPVYNNIKSSDDLNTYFNDVKQIYIFKNEVMYVLYNNNNICSFNLLMYRFFNIDIDHHINNQENSIIIKDNGNIFADICKKYYFMFDLKKYVVTLF